MAYSPTNVFANGTTIVSADVQENIEDIQEYVNGLNVSGDFATDNWANNDFFVQGKYYPFGNYQEFITGVCKGGYPFYEHHPGMTLQAHGDSKPQTVGIKPGVAGINFYMEETGNVLLHLQIYPRVLCHSVKHTRADIMDDAQNTVIFIRFNGNVVTSTRGFVREELQPGLDATNGIPSWECNAPYQMNILIENVAKGEHEFEIALGTNARQTYNKWFNYSLTAYYD